jgi:glutathione S-transferase
MAGITELRSELPVDAMAGLLGSGASRGENVALDRGHSKASMLQLHYFPGNASMVPHLLLEEMGAPYELKLVDRAHAAHKSPEYLKLNPNGLIPVLVDTQDGAGEPIVLYETAAICLHLVDTHPAAGLVPPLGTAERAQACKWLVWLTNTLQTTLIIYFYPERWADAAAAVAQVKAHAEAKAGTLLDQLDAELARHGDPWLLGAAFSLVDPYAFVLCRWTRGFGRPARKRAHLKPWLERVLARPATQRTFAQEGLAAPWF